MNKQTEFDKWFQKQLQPVEPEEAWDACWEYWESKLLMSLAKYIKLEESRHDDVVTYRMGIDVIKPQTTK